MDGLCAKTKTIGVKKPPSGGYFADGAQEKTRTSTPLRALGPEPSASTNSATWALFSVMFAISVKLI